MVKAPRLAAFSQIAILSLALLCSKSWGMSGNDLYNLLQSNDAGMRLGAIAYVRGYIDGSSWTAYTFRQNQTGKWIAGSHFCMPPGATIEQAMDVIRASLANNPASRHLDANVLVFGALVAAWPCKEQ